MITEPETVGRSNRAGGEIAGSGCDRDRGGKQRMNPGKDRIEQLAGVLPVLEKAVQHRRSRMSRSLRSSSRPTRKYRTM